LEPFVTSRGDPHETLHCLLGGVDLPGGLPAGLHANGFPSGAQHVPVREPRSALKLHCAPLAKLLQAAMASRGGPGCCPASLGGCDMAECGTPAIKSVVNVTVLVNRIVSLLDDFKRRSPLSIPSVRQDCGGNLEESPTLFHVGWF
jgi:hypothetical protein